MTLLDYSESTARATCRMNIVRVWRLQIGDDDAWLCSRCGAEAQPYMLARRDMWTAYRCFSVKPKRLTKRVPPTDDGSQYL